jgi:hypothetical protein
MVRVIVAGFCRELEGSSFSIVISTFGPCANSLDAYVGLCTHPIKQHVPRGKQQGSFYGLRTCHRRRL